MTEVALRTADAPPTPKPAARDDAETGPGDGPHSPAVRLASRIEGLALLAAMHEERGVLDYEAQIFDLRNAGEMVMRPWPDRAAERAGRGA